jgi:hypothetical protein
MATGRRCSFATADLLDNRGGNSIFPAGGLDSPRLRVEPAGMLWRMMRWRKQNELHPN